MILSSKQHHAIALGYLRDAAEANLTLEEKRQLQRRAARFAELSRRAAVLEAEEGKSEEAPPKPIPLWATNPAHADHPAADLDGLVEGREPQRNSLTTCLH